MQKLPAGSLHELESGPGAGPKLLLIDGIGASANGQRGQDGLSPALLHILQEVQRELGFEQREHVNLEALVAQVSERVGFDLSNYERDEILSYIERDENPFGILQPLVDDPSISDIIATDFSKVCIQQGRRNFSTDVRFPNAEVYEAFVERLLQRAGATYSTKKPIADGMIGSFARIHAVHKSLCDTGPYLTVRLNRFSSVHSDDLARVGFAPPEVLAYLKAIIRAGQTVMVVGEVGTGKTTLVRALAATIPADESILVIEDTPEIRLQHPHVRYISTREANSDGAGRVAPSECIRAGMRMAMNRIIFGEIRDAEAGEAFIDVCASGHPGMSTIHGRSVTDAVKRLELFLGRAQKSVERGVLTDQVATAVQVIVHVDICRETGRRRIMDVREIGPVADGVLRQRELFRYSPVSRIPQWRVVNKVSSHRELLEGLEPKVVLSSYPNTLELSPDIALREAALRRGA